MHDHQTITVRGVATQLHVGVSDAERAAPQVLRIGVTLTLFDPPRFDSHDALRETIDYDAIIGFIRSGLPATGPAHLIECVSERVARYCLDLSARIASAEVTVAKPGVLGEEGEVEVTLLRFADKATHRHALFLAEEAKRQEAKL